LLPKGSFLTTTDENNVESSSNNDPLHTSAAAAAAAAVTASVTIMSKQKLPAYGSERFWMLSELQQAAHSVRFLSDLGSRENHHDDDYHDNDKAMQNQPDPTRIPSPRDIITIQQDANHHQHHSVAPFLILYILWGHEHSDPTISASSSSSLSGPSAFVERIVLPAVNTIRQHYQIVPSDGALATSNTTTPTKDPPDQFHHHQQQQQQQQVGFRRASSFATPPRRSKELDPLNTPFTITSASNNLPSASLYLVIDRVQPSSHDRNDNHDHTDHHREPILSLDPDESEEKLAEHLARNVATHPALRGCVEGITTGVSNHVRAAPGLEAIIHAVTLGSSDRRRHGNTDDPSSQRSLLEVIAPSSDDLLGLQNSQITDAVQGISQSLIIAEWNGRGNLQSYARRAQARWNRQHNVPDHCVKALRPEVRLPPRRIRRTRQVLESARNRVMTSGRRAAHRLWLPPTHMRKTIRWVHQTIREQGWDLLAWTVILAYVAFHCPRERQQIMLWLCYLADQARDQITAAR
jgi:hypothetical protein